MKKSLACFVALLLCVAVLAGCTQPGASAPPAPAPQADTTPAVPTPTQEGGATPTAPSAALPFTDADVRAISAGFETVGAYVDALDPTAFSWWYEGEATGSTYLLMYSEDAGGELLGITTLVLTTEDGTIFGEEEGESGFLPDELLALPARLAEAEWLEPGYALPAIRTVALGATAQQVLEAFFTNDPAAPSYTAQAINPAVDASWDLSDYEFVGAMVEQNADPAETIYGYRWCTLTAPEEWREAYFLEYVILDGAVDQIRLTYESDPE